MIMLLMMQDGEKSVVPPVIATRIEVIVNRNDAGSMILRVLDHHVRMQSSANPTKVFDDEQIKTPRFDVRLDRVEGFAIESFATNAAGNAHKFNFSFVSIRNVLADQLPLIVQTSFVLVHGADTLDVEYFRLQLREHEF